MANEKETLDEKIKRLVGRVRELRQLKWEQAALVRRVELRLANLGVWAREAVAELNLPNSGGKLDNGALVAAEVASGKWTPEFTDAVASVTRPDDPATLGRKILEAEAVLAGLKRGADEKLGLMNKTCSELDACRKDFDASRKDLEAAKTDAGARIASAEEIIKGRGPLGCEFGDWVRTAAAALPLDETVRPRLMMSDEARQAGVPFFVGGTGYITAGEGATAAEAEKCRRFYDDWGRLVLVRRDGKTGEARLVFQRCGGRWVGEAAWRTGLIAECRGFVGPLARVIEEKPDVAAN